MPADPDPKRAGPPRENGDIAAKLLDMAHILEAQGEEGFRVAAYKRAADYVSAFPRPLSEVLRERGAAGLVALPTIGNTIAGAVVELLSRGRWSQLERLTGEIAPERLFQTLPGIGPALAHRIHEALHVDTLEQLEAAAYDGRLEAEVGPRRTAGLRAALSERLRRPRAAAPAPVTIAPVALILEVDRAYRDGARAGALRTIAPKRFNPGGEAWLPVLHLNRAPWRFTALFSNTQRAHDLGKTHDWVVVYAVNDGEPESQCTVVTETRGALEGRRVVRGREAECAAHYGQADAQPAADGQAPGAARS